MGAQPGGFGTQVSAAEVIFRLPAEPGAFSAVRVWLDLDHHGERPPMRRVAAGWELPVARPPVQRLEYLFAVEHRDGSQAMICDPVNQRRAPTPFGDHSVIEFPGYRAPGWLAVRYAAGSSVSFAVRAPGLRPAVPVTLWSPDGVPSGVPLALLLLHDGPEFEQLTSVTRFSSVLIGAGRLPPHRVALLGPGDRNRWYAASPAYGQALTSVVLPRLRAETAVTGPVALAGASLGAVAALQAATGTPAPFNALFLQSGSFFRTDTDQQESSFPRFAAVASFVRRLGQGAPASTALDIGMTCGRAEENLANNRLMARTLAGLGHRVELAEVPDAHTWAGWRDAFDPYLADLLARVWGPAASWPATNHVLPGSLDSGALAAITSDKYQSCREKPGDAVDGEVRHLVGLLLGTEDDWPRAFEFLLSGLSPVTDAAGRRHVFSTERLTIEPFSLRAKPRTDLVIDRLAYWYFHPREWLKKIALMDSVYLLNSPFSFQAMEKHAAYCAMIRLGLKIPETVLVPYKNPLDNAKYTDTSQRYNSPFDLDEVAARLGYPLYMKPYDGGGWRGVSKIRNAEELNRAYNSSGEMLMHLQAAIEDYDVFARALSIGAETMVMRFDPDAPMHSRYRVEHDFLRPATGAEAVAISRIINAFFRWEFNSCEMLVKGDDVYPIDYANACPDASVTSLHYYFPWAMRALVKWTVFCLATGRRVGTDLHTRAYFDISDRDDLTYEQKLAGYLKLADSYFAVDEYHEFCANQLADIDERVLEWATGPEFDQLIVDTVAATYPAHEQERFIAHFRGLTGLWAREETARLAAPNNGDGTLLRKQQQ